jgi:hypothetical protein
MSLLAAIEPPFENYDPVESSVQSSDGESDLAS